MLQFEKGYSQSWSGSHDGRIMRPLVTLCQCQEADSTQEAGSRCEKPRLTLPLARLRLLKVPQPSKLAPPARAPVVRCMSRRMPFNPPATTGFWKRLSTPSLNVNSYYIFEFYLLAVSYTKKNSRIIYYIYPDWYSKSLSTVHFSLKKIW